MSDYCQELLLSRYRDHNRCNGLFVGSILCLDNLGCNYDQESVSAQLRGLLNGVVDIRFAGVKVGSAMLQFGWCCIQFETTCEAVGAIEVLDNVYLETGKILRPLLPHFPNWLSRDEFQTQIDGKVIPVELHLGQENTVDRESLRLLKIDSLVKRLRDKVLEDAFFELVPLFKMVQSKDEEETSDMECESFSESGFIWLRNVSALVSDEMLLNFFRKMDSVATIKRIIDPVTMKTNGAVIVRVSSQEKAKMICEDINEGTLISEGFQPIKASVLDFDYSFGFDFLFDKAMAEAGLDSSKTASTIVHKADYSTQNEQIAAKIRSVMERMQHSRTACHDFKCKQRRAEYAKISKHVNEIYSRFQRLEPCLDESDYLLSSI